MPINSELNKFLSVIRLQGAAKDAIAKGLPMCEDLKDIFTDMADDKTKVEATFCLVVDTKIVTDIDIRRFMFGFDWFLSNIFDMDVCTDDEIMEKLYIKDDALSDFL
jgi:hypothetical protein